MGEGPRQERAGMTQAGDDETDGRPGESHATGRKTLALLAASGGIAFLLYATLGREGHEAAVPPPEAGTAAHQEAAPDAGAAPATEGAAEETASEAPGFDVVRVAPDGSAVVAGRAAPGSVVTVYADGEPLAEAEADADGDFVAIFTAAPSEEPRALTLDAVTPEGESAASEEVVMLLPEAAPTAEAGAAPEEGAPPAESAPEAVRPQPRVAATAILRPEGVEVAPTGDAAGVASPGRQVSLASISYGEGGAVALAGLGGAGARLRAYVDDDFALETDVGPDGRWAIELGDVAQGVYRLRIDQIDAEGRVSSRVETPFQRDYPAVPLPRPDGGARPAVVTVQPGANLWTLARVHYGSGVLYTQIFTANRELIRDPDLIYPGQILALPGVEATE